MNEWILMVPLKVFTRLKTEFSQTIKTQYGMTDNNFSTVNNNGAEAVFPFVFLNALPGEEVGMDLQGDAINGGLFSFQIDVYDNKSQSRSRKVMAEVVRVMKSMGFEIVAMPNFENVNEPFRMVVRFRRIIGASENF